VDENKKYFIDLVSKFKDKKYQHAFLRFLQNRDITNFNPQKFDKSELHETLEQNSVSPIVGFLAEIVKEYDGEKETVRYTTTETYNNCCEYMRDNKFKYDISQQKFNVELEITYKIKKIRSSEMKFEFNIKAIKAMLEKDYKYSFSAEDELNKELEDVEKPKQINPLDANIITTNNNSDYENALNKIKELEAEILRLKQLKVIAEHIKEEIKEEVKEILKNEVVETLNKKGKQKADDLDSQIKELFKNQPKTKKATTPDIIPDEEYENYANILLEIN
jgi:hypothetical protein